MKASREPQTLRNSRQFRKVYDQGQRYHTPHFSAFILRNDGIEQRIGITVTRKIGNAVIRNRCKRRLREVIRGFFTQAPDSLTAPGYDLVINAKSSLVDAEFKQVQASFARVIAKIGESPRKQTREA
jgi:ribonuclease P protein component